MPQIRGCSVNTPMNDSQYVLTDLIQELGDSLPVCRQRLFDI